MKDVFEKWLDEEREIRTRGKITEKQKAIILDKIFNGTPFAKLFEIKESK